ncbi:MAG: homoserine kinase [Actinomycetota bacterium]|nr:homoserine kinase [Actinomycetota bacterium]
MSAALDRAVNPAEEATAAVRVIEPGQRVTVRVPATSANLGPGFDSLGLAVALYDTLAVESVAHNVDGEELVFELSGQGALDLPRDASHLAVRAMDAAFARLGYVRGPLRIAAENVLPHGRGLGSSASAIVAAICAANALVAEADRRDSQWILQLASELEGHPDNVAPAIFGAVAISWQQGERYRSVRVTPAPSVIPVVAVPAVELSTETARAMLPTTVPHQSAAANSGRTALLIHALTQDPSLLLDGTEDFLHQEYRAQAMPASAELMNALRAEGFAAFISGAGPTVMTLANGAAEAARAVAFIAQLGAAESSGGLKGGDWRVLRLEVDSEGAKVELHRR